MAKNNYDYLAIVNRINKDMGGIYGYEFPVVTSENFKAMSAAFVNAPQMVKNAYIDNLFAAQWKILVKRIFKASNPFRKLYGEDQPMTGEGNGYIQEISLDQIVPLAYEYDPNPERFFQDAPPKVKVQYMTNILRKKYEVSVNSMLIQPAFRSLGTFTEFMNKISDRLYADVEEDDKEEILAAFDGAIEGSNVYLVPSVRPVDSSTALAFSTTLDNVSRDLSFRRSRKWNLSHLSTKTDEENAIIIVSGDVIAVQNNYNLAWAFHRTYLDLFEKGQIIELDSQGMAGNKVFALYTDSGFLRVNEVEGFPIMKHQEFGDTLTEKRWYHDWKNLNISYSSNAVAFASTDDIGVESIVIQDKDGNTSSTVKKGKWLQLDVPKVTAVEGKLADAFVEYSISGQNSPSTKIDPYDGTLYVGKDETCETITITAKSHLDDSKTATYEVTVSA